MSLKLLPVVGTMLLAFALSTNAQQPQGSTNNTADQSAQPDRSQAAQPAQEQSAPPDRDRTVTEPGRTPASRTAQPTEPTATNPNPSPATPTGTAGVAGQLSANPNDPNATDANQNAGNANRRVRGLPNTASPLPLFMLGAFSSFAGAGFLRFVRR